MAALRQVVVESGGDIQLDSAAERGTTIRFLWPIARARLAPPVAPRQADPLRQHRRRHRSLRARPGPPSRWDRYLHGERNALTWTERKGLKLFTSFGCMTCHSRYQLSETMSLGDVAAIVAWLSALPGELQRRHIAEPELPASAPPTHAVATR